jgi:hypothetical protein
MGEHHGIVVHVHHACTVATRLGEAGPACRAVSAATSEIGAGVGAIIPRSWARDRSGGVRAALKKSEVTANTSGPLFDLLCMTEKYDDAAHAREDSFLAELIPQVAEQLAERYALDFDTAAGQARFEAWLAAHTGPA